MKRASSAESGELRTTDFSPVREEKIAQDGSDAAPTRHSSSAIRLWLAVLFGFACLATAYFFAFRAAHSAQIRDVPLATKGARP